MLSPPACLTFYRGTELWTFSLVDPDNRRPVDSGEQARSPGGTFRERKRPAARQPTAKTPGRLGGRPGQLYLIYEPCTADPQRKLFRKREYTSHGAVGARRAGHVSRLYPAPGKRLVLSLRLYLAARLYAAGLGLVSEEAKEPSLTFTTLLTPCQA